MRPKTAVSQVVQAAHGSNSGTDLVVATVGRLYDFVRAGIVEMKDVNCLVLDEADRMMDMGFEAGAA